MGFVYHVGGPRHFDESWSCFDTVTTGQTDRQTDRQTPVTFHDVHVAQ